MAVLRSKDGRELLVDCSCGCNDGFRIRVNKEETDDTYFIVSYVNASFYRDQNTGMLRALGKKLKKLWRIIRNKDYCYSEICMTREDVKEFREFFESLDEEK